MGKVSIWGSDFGSVTAHHNQLAIHTTPGLTINEIHILDSSFILASIYLETLLFEEKTCYVGCLKIK